MAYLIRALLIRFIIIVATTGPVAFALTQLVPSLTSWAYPVIGLVIGFSIMALLPISKND